MIQGGDPTATGKYLSSKYNFLADEKKNGRAFVFIACMFYYLKIILKISLNKTSF